LVSVWTGFHEEVKNGVFRKLHDLLTCAPNLKALPSVIPKWGFSNLTSFWPSQCPA